MEKVIDMPNRAQLDQAFVKVEKKVTTGLWLTHGSYVFFLLLMSWLNFEGLNGNIASSIKLWLVKIIPLIIFIPGFLKHYYRTYSWLCFAILPYFIWITPLVIGRGLWSDWLLESLTVVIFIAAMMTSRWLQQYSHLQWQIANTPAN